MRQLFITGFVFITGFLGLVTAVPAVSQTTPIANVYVQTKSGIRVYNAAPSGQLTLVTGSPFYTAGQMEAVRGTSYLISVGTSYLHSYKLKSSGGVGAQVSQINTGNYGGSQCGTTAGLSGNILDKTGQYFTVQLWGAEDSNGNTICSAYQTYKISSTGYFTYLGVAENTTIGYRYPAALNISTYSSNDLFAYGAGQTDPYASQFYAFKRASAGDLIQNANFTQNGPTPNPNAGSNYFPILVAADPFSHLAAVMNLPFSNSSNSDVFQLASFSINDTTGAISSTNTYANMPKLDVYPSSIAMSPSGKVLAIGGSPGLQLFHFNGASAPTLYHGNLFSLTANPNINQVAWDNSNHLYALSYDTGYLHATAKLYVFTVTTTSVTPAPGSPYKISGSFGAKGLIVVPR
jgi:hypothetical protein